MYYRYSDSQDPMSGWGHAMFVNNAEESAHYGDICYTFDGAGAINIDDLKGEIVGAWVAEKRNGLANVPVSCDSLFNLKLKDFIAMFNPTDIVDSAAAFDSEIITWLWEQVLEPNNIEAIKTNNGAVVFDAELITKN
jgi:hypothetical protein